MRLAIIPARGGSKGRLDKNLVKLNGMPLIQYTIEAALGSNLIDDVILSTDSIQIKEFAASIGLTTEYVRPRHLATDSSSMIDTVLHCLDWYLTSCDKKVNDVVLLQPTSPLRTSIDIDSALDLYLTAGAHSLFSVNKLANHPFECISGNSGGWSYLAKSRNRTIRRQDYEEDYFFINGAIYITSKKYLKENKSFIEENKSLFYLMPTERSIDIDDLNDLNYAEFILYNSKKIII